MEVIKYWGSVYPVSDYIPEGYEIYNKAGPQIPGYVYLRKISIKHPFPWVTQIEVSIIVIKKELTERSEIKEKTT